MRAWTKRTPRYEMHAVDTLAFGSSRGDEEHETGRPNGGDTIRPNEDPDWYLDLDSSGEKRRGSIAIW
jgi:hypothetical protein